MAHLMLYNFGKNLYKILKIVLIFCVMIGIRTYSIGVFGISLYTFTIFYAVKKYVKINMSRMQEHYHLDSMDREWKNNYITGC